MKFLSLSHRKKKKTNWFAWGIFLYIVLGSSWFYSQSQKNNTQGEQITSVQNSRETVKTSFDARDETLKKSIPYDVNTMENVFIGTSQVTSGKTFKLISPASEAWRKRIVRRIQLYGVDTCETRQGAMRDGQEWPCGAVVTAWLVTKTLDKEIVCQPSIVRLGITFAQCFIGGVDIAEMGLSEGILMVASDTENQPPAQYLNLESQAKLKRLGLWSSELIDPAQWRRDNGTYNPFDPQ